MRSFMRRLTAAALVLALVATACSKGSKDDAATTVLPRITPPAVPTAGATTATNSTTAPPIPYATNSRPATPAELAAMRRDLPASMMREFDASAVRVSKTDATWAVATHGPLFHPSETPASWILHKSNNVWTFQSYNGGCAGVLASPAQDLGIFGCPPVT